MTTTTSASTESSWKSTLVKASLTCGVLSSLLYLAMNIFIPMYWEGYNVLDQAVSELSAIGAPTRPIWVPWGIAYTMLVIVFGWGVLQSASNNRPLQVVGWLLMADGLIGLFWPPMNMRGEEMAQTDVLHIVFSGAWLLFALLVLGFGAVALGKRFRNYTLLTLALFIVFGILTGIVSPNLAKNLPTPWLGLWERINIGIYMLWHAVLAVALLKAAANPPVEEQVP